MIYEDEDIIFNISRPDLILPPQPNQNESLMDFEISSLPPFRENRDIWLQDLNIKFEKGVF